jgi:type I restriction enzyme R subunit
MHGDDLRTAFSDLKGPSPRNLAHMRVFAQAWRYRNTLEKIEFAAVVSGSSNDDAAWKRWTEAAANETRLKRFKKPLFHAKPEKTDPLAFLVVKSMLLPVLTRRLRV